MALDGANFISELSITDPPGTDPLSEGDDQIRTSKRTQFNSFEFVDKAVLKTADQLNDGAQRSEVNTFSLTQTFSVPLEAADGVTVLPSYAFTSEPSMGMFRSQAGVLGFGVANEEVFRAALSNVRTGPNTVFRSGPDGVAGTPGYGFQSGQNNGMFLAGVNIVGFSTSGVERFRVSNGQTTTFFAAEFDGAINQNAVTNIVTNFAYQRAGVNRWQMRMGNDSQGNDYSIRRHNDSGTFLSDSIRIQRSDGLWIFTLSDIPTVDPGVPGALFRSLANFLQVSV